MSVSRKAARLNSFFLAGRFVHFCPGCLSPQCLQGLVQFRLMCPFSPGFGISPQLKHMVVPRYLSMSMGIPCEFAGAVYEPLVVLFVGVKVVRPDVLLLKHCRLRLSSICSNALQKSS